MSGTGRIQAKDLDDVATLRAVIDDARERGVVNLGACWWTLREKHLPRVPEKVVHAKLRALLKRGLVSGCACGCRGDFLLTDAGRALLAAAADAERAVNA